MQHVHIVTHTRVPILRTEAACLYACDPKTHTCACTCAGVPILPKEALASQLLISNLGSGLSAVEDKGLTDDNRELHILRRHEGRFMQAMLVPKRCGSCSCDLACMRLLAYGSGCACTASGVDTHRVVGIEWGQSRGSFRLCSSAPNCPAMQAPCLNPVHYCSCALPLLLHTHSQPGVGQESVVQRHPGPADCSDDQEVSGSNVKKHAHGRGKMRMHG